MSFLPIVERELRAASRRKSTRRIRWWTALIAMVVGFFSLSLILLSSGPHHAGASLFSILSGYAFGICLLTGMFLTADCLSQERREGTLGLLFLTDLHGYDVVLGKFAARSLNAFYALFSLLPVMALPLLLGGVLGTEFWRMSLALANVLFFSLAAGTCVSAFMKDSQKAMGNTLLLLLFLVGVVPALPALLSLVHIGSGWDKPMLLSPAWPFLYARESLFFSGSSKFWNSLFGSHLFAWALLALASWSLPRLWRTQSLRGGNSWAFRFGRPFGLLNTRRSIRVGVKNPIFWLLAFRSGLGHLPWFLLCAWTTLVICVTWYNPGDPGWVYYSAKVCGFIFKMLIASETCRFFAEARRTGALELLLCTPLKNDDLLRGQTLALKRAFLLPLLLFVVVGCFPLAIQVTNTLANTGSSRFAPLVAQITAAGAASAWFIFGFVADIFAVIWFGRWLALTGKNPTYAAPLTVLIVLILPSVGLCGLDLVADFVFIVWGTSSLSQGVRQLFAKQQARLSIQPHQPGCPCALCQRFPKPA